MGRRECEERETDRERKGGGSETYNNNCFQIIGKSHLLRVLPRNHWCHRNRRFDKPNQTRCHHTNHTTSKTKIKTQLNLMQNHLDKQTRKILTRETMNE